MNLINKEVIHDVYGKGIITNCDGSFVEINFTTEPAGIKKFVFPDAFGTYLTPVEEQTADLVGKIKQEQRKKEREKKELRRKKLQVSLKREQSARKARARRVHPSSQSVFWCEPEELNSIFINWQISTGTIQSGVRKGQPRRLARLALNSACLITVRDAKEPEENRRIIGAFMVNRFFDSKATNDGLIRSHSRYRLRLPDQVADKMLFWNYYFDEKSPHDITWNTGRQRYFDNEIMATILQDAIPLIKDSFEQRRAQHFLKYFCKMNNLSPEELPEPNGALMRA